MAKNVVESKTMILDILDEIYTRTGKVSINEIAEHSHVSRMTIYRLFGSKENLISQYNKAKQKNIPIKSKECARLKILKAAGKCFANKGFQGASIEEIASIAKVGVTTVYRTFKDKESLITAYIEEIGRSKIKQELSSSKDLKTTLIQFAISILTLLEEDMDLFKIGLTQVGNNAELMAKLNDSPNRSLYILTHYLKAQGCISDQRICQDLAMAFMGMLLAFGFLYPYSYQLPLNNKEEKATLIVDLFLNGIKGFS
ncbi:UNVERIFIED_CONTAM: TetR family transcriptional regulator [Acetivibrio alkalicellulosi]